MIKTNELRVGNYIQISGVEMPPLTPETLAHILEQDVLDTRCNPIRLTDEWLLKFGFEDGEKRVSYHKIRVREFSTDSQGVFEGEFQLTFLDDVPFSLPYRIKYLHQLQNLYFAVTGNELEINL